LKVWACNFTFFAHYLQPFKFLKSLDLTSVGLGLDKILFEFGWELVIWKPFGVQFWSKAVLGPNKANFDVVDVLDELPPSEDDGDSNTVRAEIGSEPVFEMGDLGVGPESVPELGEVGVESPPLFEENVDVSFYKVADFERDEEVDTPVVTMQPKTIRLPNLERGRKRKGSKTLLAKQTFPLFVSSGPCKLKLHLLPHNLNRPSQNPQSKP